MDNNNQQIIKFKPKILQEQANKIKILINKLTVQTLSDQLSNLSSPTLQLLKEFYFIDGFHILQCISQWKIVHFYSSIITNEQNIMIKSISHIRFQNLQLIQIFNLTLNNIEPIIFLDCPNLKRLCIQSEQHFSIKPLIKTNFNKMLVIQISQKVDPQNSDINHLRRFHMPKQMTKLQIFFQAKNQERLKSNVFINTYRTGIDVNVSFMKWLCYA